MGKAFSCGSHLDAEHKLTSLLSISLSGFLYILKMFQSSVSLFDTVSPVCIFNYTDTASVAFSLYPEPISVCLFSHTINQSSFMRMEQLKTGWYSVKPDILWVLLSYEGFFAISNSYLLSFLRMIYVLVALWTPVSRVYYYGIHFTNSSFHCASQSSWSDLIHYELLWKPSQLGSILHYCHSFTAIKNKARFIVLNVRFVVPFSS